jgi:hypothetical protein
MTAGTESRIMLPVVPSELLLDHPDEFDLDLRCGELDQAGSWFGYLPTAGEVPGETCDTHAATCSATCQATCVATCRATCQNTCHTCEFDTCGATCANTHCPTCSPNCHTP